MTARTFYVAVMALVAAAATPVAADSEPVDVYFLAPWNSVVSQVDDFSKQFNVMLVRTGAVTADEITSVVPKESSDGSILVTVTLNSLQGAVSVTKVVENRQLSVYIDGKGYIGVIPNTVPVTKAPVVTTEPNTATTDSTASTESTAVPDSTTPATTADPTASTEHPAVHGYVWLNEYTSDNENLNDCSTGNPWSGIVISRMPVGCHRFSHPLTKQDEYNFLDLNNGAVGRFGMVCDTSCASCISQVDSFEYGSCVQTWGGSVTTTSSSAKPCMGATYLDQAEGAVSIFRYSEPGCDIEKSLSAKLYVRNYPPTTMGADAVCTRDGMSGSYYALSKVADENGDIFYNGKYGCTDEDCSEGCTQINSWQEGACQRDAQGNGIAIWETENVLKECASAEPENPHSVAGDAAVQMADVEVKMAEEVVEESSSTEESSSSTDSTTEASTEATTRATRPTSTVEYTDPIDEEQMVERHPVEENKQMLSVVIAAGGVLAIAFLIAGVLHSRKRRLQEIENDIDDDIYDEYDYNGYAKYDDWEDDRLVTDI